MNGLKTEMEQSTQKQYFADNAFQANAVNCPACGAKPGTRCKRPSEHRADRLHDARKTFADQKFFDIYGEKAEIDYDEKEDRWGVRAEPRGAFIDHATMGGRRANQPAPRKNFS